MQKENEKEKDMKPPYQDEREGLSYSQVRQQREGWSPEEIAEQGSKIDETEVQRQMRRGDETKGDPDERDVAGTVESEDAPHGREETKNDKKGATNVNG